VTYCKAIYIYRFTAQWKYSRLYGLAELIQNVSREQVIMKFSDT